MGKRRYCIEEIFSDITAGKIQQAGFITAGRGKSTDIMPRAVLRQVRLCTILILNNCIIKS